MSTTVTITGTGTPIQTPDRAGPGVLIRSGNTALQFDAGRATVMRLAAEGSRLTDLSALFVTHHHSDHIVGIPDLLMTRWLNDIERSGQDPLPVYVPDGPATDLVDGLLDAWRGEMEMRQRHTGRPNVAEVDLRSFTVSKDSATHVVEVGGVHVSAVAVEHEPVVPAVAYRVDTEDGSIVISGDTDVCRQVEDLSRGVDILVHEAIRAEGLRGLVSDPSRLLAYHSEPIDIGGLAQSAGVGHLILTHMVPPPQTENERRAYEQEVRDGGYTGRLTVAEDLFSVKLG